MTIKSFIFIYITYLYKFSDVYFSHDYHLDLYVGSLKSQSKSFLVEVANSQYHFLINVLQYSKHNNRKSKIFKWNMTIIAFIYKVINNPTSRNFVFYMTLIISQSWFPFDTRSNTMFIILFTVC